MNSSNFWPHLFFGIIALGLVYRIYDVFFGPIAKLMRNDPGTPKFYINAYHRWGESIAEELRDRRKREEESGSKSKPIS